VPRPRKRAVDGHLGDAEGGGHPLHGQLVGVVQLQQAVVQGCAQAAQALGQGAAIAPVYLLGIHQAESEVRLHELEQAGFVQVLVRPQHTAVGRTSLHHPATGHQEILGLGVQLAAAVAGAHHAAFRPVGCTSSGRHGRAVPGRTSKVSGVRS
jgi:hypothetical protein